MKEKEIATLSDRINHALELTGTRKADLARAIEVKPQVIQFLCTSSTKSSRFTFEIATALGLNTRWLATGQGTMFLADDPKNKFLNEYKRIPVFTPEQIVKNSLGTNYNINQHVKWAAIETEKEDVFCMKAQDSSMAPYLPLGSLIFFSKNKDYTSKQGNIVLVFMKQYATVVVREIIIKNKEVYLCPKNTELFKKTLLTNEMEIVGLAIEFHCVLGEKQ